MLNKKLPYTNSISEVIYKLDCNIWDNSTKINFKINKEYVETTCGKIKLYDICGILINYELDKNGIEKLIIELHKKYDEITVSKILKKLNEEFNNQATKSGLSLCINDLKKNDYQKGLLDKAKKETKNKRGIEKSKIWDKYINEAVDNWIETVDKKNSLYLMMKSGARVNKSQIRQMIIAKGLLINMDGNITENAISESLSDGLSTINYFRTCSPARNGLANNFFIVPTSGYFERQLVNLLRDFRIVGEDCHSNSYVESNRKSSLGRFSNEGVFITDLKEKSFIRSPLTCIQEGGLCKTCCGIDPSKFKFNNKDILNLNNSRNYLFCENTGIGIIAAQTLVEPATQLGLRGKHTSGSTTMGEYENKIENILGLIMKSIGSPTSRYINIKDECINNKNIDGDNYIEKSVNLCNYIQSLYDTVKIPVNRLWIEIMIRGLSEVQIDPKTNQYFLRMFEPDNQFDFTIYNIIESLQNYPSFDKRNQFGYIKNNIHSFLVKDINKDYELFSERLMYGNIGKKRLNLK